MTLTTPTFKVNSGMLFNFCVVRHSGSLEMMRTFEKLLEPKKFYHKIANS